MDLALEIPRHDPLAIFDAWLTEARATEPNDPNAMALATADAQGRPSVRMVLLKGHGTQGFTFYTNGHSRKGAEMAENPRAALLFHWKSLRRQIRIEGPLAPVGEAEADAYFHSRSRASQLGAVASDQSRPLDSRATFLDRYEQTEARFANSEVARPPHWTGYRLVPERIEFWIDRPNRLHERRLFTADRTDGWVSEMLFP